MKIKFKSADGRTWSLQRVAQCLAVGQRTLRDGSFYPDDVVSRAKKFAEYQARDAGRPVNVSLTGRVKRETEKAVLFSGKAESGELISGWFPKSQVTVMERSMAHLDQLVIPEWLYQKKLEEDKS